jgi:spore maturation protein CgeB
VVGALYPKTIAWPANVTRIDHLSPPKHPRFYSAQKFTLNLTRAEMVQAGHSPSVRIFEAAACATPVISDIWKGLEGFFTPGREVLVARSAEDVLRHLREISEKERRALGHRARVRFLAEHTAAHRADTFATYVAQVLDQMRVSPMTRSRERRTAAS